jgi:hypothetical protein
LLAGVGIVVGGIRLSNSKQVLTKYHVNCKRIKECASETCVCLVFITGLLGHLTVEYQSSKAKTAKDKDQHDHEISSIVNNSGNQLDVYSKLVKNSKPFEEIIPKLKHFD